MITLEDINRALDTRPRLVFVCSGEALADIKRIKDETGQYIWSADMTGKSRGTLYGMRVEIDDDISGVEIRVRPRGRTRDEVVAWINAHQTPAGGFTREFAQSMGVEWPLKRGWKVALIDKLVAERRDG